jgi:hypothetical protein
MPEYFAGTFPPSLERLLANCPKTGSGTRADENFSEVLTWPAGGTRRVFCWPEIELKRAGTSFIRSGNESRPEATAKL